MKKVSFIIASFAAVLSLSSCQEQLTPRVSNKIMKANVKAENVVTKSSEDNAEFLGTIKGDGLQLDMFVTEGIMSSSSYVTKGQLYTTDNFGSAAVDAWLDEEVSGINTHYIVDGSIASSGEITAGGDPCYWINEIPMHIWCYLPEGLGLNTEDKTSATFNYSITDQEDIVVSYNKEMYPETNETFDVTMKHALAGVRFDLALLSTDKVIKSFKFTGLSGSASCTVDSRTGFTWSNVGSATNFSVSSNATSNDGYFPLAVDGNNELFFFMPQKLGDDASVILEVYDNVKDATSILTGSLKDVELKSGHTYTITIKATFVIDDVPVDDIESTTIQFQGSQAQQKMFSSLNPNNIQALHLIFDFAIGNGGHSEISIVKKGTDEVIKTIYYSNAAKYTDNEIAVGTNGITNYDFTNNPNINKKEWDPNGVLGNLQHGGRVDITFDISDVEDVFDITFKYFGGNNGAAGWAVRNIKLSKTVVQ